MRVLLFQNYGSNLAYKLELTYCVLSAYQFLKNEPENIHLALICEDHNKRPDLPVENLIIPNELIHDWQQNGTYVHGFQAYALEYAIKYFNATVILVDTDTVFLNHPKYLFERISPGRALMNAKECPIKELPEWPDWKSLLQETNGMIGKRTVTEDSIMYNSGVLGLHPSDSDLLCEVQSIMRSILEKSSVFTAVQLAYSLVLTEETDVAVCDDIINHYWSENRAYFRYQFARMFSPIVSGKLLDSLEFKLPVLHENPPVKFRNRLLSRWKKLHGDSTEEYRSAYLAYISALSCKNADPELANVWAEQALNMLTWGIKRSISNAYLDFTAFSASEISQQNWMNHELRDRWIAYWG